jgi:hypothetical protein
MNTAESDQKDQGQGEAKILHGQLPSSPERM